MCQGEGVRETRTHVPPVPVKWWNDHIGPVPPRRRLARLDDLYYRRRRAVGEIRSVARNTRVIIMFIVKRILTGWQFFFFWVFLNNFFFYDIFLRPFRRIIIILYKWFVCTNVRVWTAAAFYAHKMDSIDIYTCCSISRIHDRYIIYICTYTTA